MEMTNERKEKINILIRYFNFQTGTVHKFSNEKNQIAVYQALIAANDDVFEIKNFIREAAKNGEKILIKVMNDFVAQASVKAVEQKKQEAEQKAQEQAQFNETTALNFLGGVVTNMLSSMKLDEIKDSVSKSLQEDCRKFIAENYGPITRKIEIQFGEKKTELKGVLHSKFDTVLKFVAADEPVFLTGPAGSGKNVICKQIAQTLGLDFYFTNAVTQEYKLTGFTDANGIFHESQFYKAFKNGGVFMLDEMDASIPEVLIILNAAIANRYFDFPAPIGYVEANENFRVVAAGNTYGSGADYTYVGRSQLDAASLDRFAMVQIDYDSRIEEACANGDLELLGFCRAFRRAVQKAGIQTVVSYRAISRMAKLASCMSITDVLDTCLVKSLGADDMKAMESNINGFGKYSAAFKELMAKKTMNV